MKAAFAVDGDLTTSSHTECAWNTDLWYKMEFDGIYCFSDVVIINYIGHVDNNKYRMRDTKVLVINTDTGTESLCGVVKATGIQTIEGYTYRIPCDLQCGDEVKLTVRHDNGQYYNKACIHMKEITTFLSGN